MERVKRKQRNQTLVFLERLLSSLCFCLKRSRSNSLRRANLGKNVEDGKVLGILCHKHMFRHEFKCKLRIKQLECLVRAISRQGHCFDVTLGTFSSEVVLNLEFFPLWHTLGVAGLLPRVLGIQRRDYEDIGMRNCQSRRLLFWFSSLVTELSVSSWQTLFSLIIT